MYQIYSYRCIGLVKTSAKAASKEDNYWLPIGIDLMVTSNNIRKPIYHLQPPSSKHRQISLYAQYTSHFVVIKTAQLLIG